MVAVEWIGGDIPVGSVDWDRAANVIRSGSVEFEAGFAGGGWVSLLSCAMRTSLWSDGGLGGPCWAERRGDERA